MIATLATATPTLSHHAYAFIADKVYEPSRIRLGDDQQALVSGRRAKRLRHLHLDSYDASCADRESTRGTEEIDQLVDCISTNHTHFFREIEQPNFLRDVTLPEWVPRLTRERATFKFWNAASSSGEEPYTVALVLAEYARVHGSFHWQIEGSDISSRILDDSAVVRRMISHALASDPEIEG
jgi:chemotaxis protein methyltransferase CheR